MFEKKENCFIEKEMVLFRTNSKKTIIKGENIMYKLKNKMFQISWKVKMAKDALLTKTDSGESHVITVIAMCVIGVALVTLLSTSLKPVIEQLTKDMQTNISAMFSNL